MTRLNLDAFLEAGGDQKRIDEMTARLIWEKSREAGYFPAIWTVRVGELPAPKLVVEVELAGVRFDCTRTRDFLTKIPISSEKKDVRLVVPSLWDLGFAEDGKTAPMIFPRASEYDLRTLTGEEAMLLFKQYTQ